MNHIDTSTEAVERLLEDVTEGPWAVDNNSYCCDVVTGFEAPDENFVICGDLSVKDARFIAAARDLVPALLKERDEARARVSALEEITDPDFIWGAMDNVHDMDVTMDDYAKAVSRAQRAALAALKDGK